MTEGLPMTGLGRLQSLISDEPLLRWLPEVRAALPEAEWFLVGGMVRDAWLGRQGRRDFDFLVRGVGLEKLAAQLVKRGEVNWVGRRFGVLKFRPSGFAEEIDIAWPRTERAGMSGAYRDFEVSYDPTLPVDVDLSRRDFTINAMAWRLADGELVDPYGGLDDLTAGVIRAVGDPNRRFGEDLTRIMRGIRFACELGFQIELSTWRAMSAVVRLNERLADGSPVVAAETIARELVKALVAAPAEAACLLEDSGALAVILPELHRLTRIPQRPEWHSEGDVWAHTKQALASLSSSRFAESFPGETPSPLAVVAVLMHDVGKGPAMKINDGKLIFWGHAEVGADLARAMAERLRLASAGINVDDLVWLVREHMFPHLVNLDEARKVTIARRFVDDERLGDALLHLYFADVAGSWRPQGGPDFTQFRALLAEVRQLRAAKVEPLLSGSQVMSSLNLVPGPAVGQLLEKLREEQLTGRLDTPEAAREWLRQQPPFKLDGTGV